MGNILNKITSLILIVVLLPILILVSIFIIVDDGFPIFFKQKRVGKDKTIFNIIKFRTMKKNTKDLATHLMKNQNKKILRSGNFLRKYSIDELPQLINIFLGDINFIGPRPALFNQEDLIELRDKYNINHLKPGITGWAQINGRDSLSIEEKTKYDYYYLKNRNFRLNIIILYKTCIKVLLAKDILD